MQHTFEAYILNLIGHHSQNGIAVISNYFLSLASFRKSTRFKSTRIYIITNNYYNTLYQSSNHGNDDTKLMMSGDVITFRFSVYKILYCLFEAKLKNPDNIIEVLNMRESKKRKRIETNNSEDNTTFPQ